MADLIQQHFATDCIVCIIALPWFYQDERLEALRNEDDFTKFSKVSPEFPIFVVNTQGEKFTLWVETDETIHSVLIKLWDLLGREFTNDIVRSPNR